MALITKVGGLCEFGFFSLVYFPIHFLDLRKPSLVTGILAAFGNPLSVDSIFWKGNAFSITDRDLIVKG